ncbi:uncharacterized protein STEHIDRAFT_160991 [Stereum hirsutum FP-91666 SS1]|uniref:uncharacterized protein n=1 Tax=Stereum hirsutum (strain FP-91666) TaxID=721885 RepID=UPI0004449A52|nr:uncharacterized protein STEHIDRAFT_160991 [Stereum hirsutum FP-91666 SS1]EIM82451.1 hypothetical protein STEHIDRAFT_160991 [Stereum hirsutum FP-91666 SS1]
MATQTLGNVSRTFQSRDSFYSEDDDATPRMPSKSTFEPLRLPSFTRTLSTSSSSSSSSSCDSSSDESAVFTPSDSYERSSKYSSTHSQLRAALASDPRRQTRPRISAHGSTSSEDEFTAYTRFPQKQAASKPQPGTRQRAVNKFAIIGRSSVILPSYPITSMPSISRSDSSSSSSSDAATPTGERQRVFPASSHYTRNRKQHTNLPTLRPSHIEIASPLVFGSATPPAFTTPGSTPRAELGEWISGTAEMHVFQVLAKVNEKLDVEATLRMKLEEAAKGMNRDVWERRMARRGRKAL